MSYCWYYSQEDIEQRTPSRDDGVPLSVETRYRRDGARFIITASNTLGLRYETPATGVVFFHRFFMIQSFKQFNRWVVAAACLLLAGKVEETPKKCKDVLKVTQSILTEHQMANFGSNPKEELLTHERILLQTIKFDLQVQHPYLYLLKYAKSLKGDKQRMEKLVQTAWTFVNDSLSTVLCLQWEPQAVAVAFLYLAGKLANYDLQTVTGSKSRSWWRQFVDTLDIHDLDTICYQVLDTYGEAADSSSNCQDDDDVDTPLLTPQQTPPSTASIPPSMSVVPPSGAIGHTTSSHLPSSSSATPTPMQLLTQHSSMQQFQTASQLLPASTLQATIATPTGVESMPLSRTSIMPNQFRCTEASHVTPSALQAALLQQQQQQQNLVYSSLNAPLAGISFQQQQQQNLVYSSLNAPLAGTSQQQAHIQPLSGGLSQGMSNYPSALIPQVLPSASLSVGGVGAVMGGGVLKPTNPPMPTPLPMAGPSGVGIGLFSHQQTQVRQFHALTGDRSSLSPLRPPGVSDGSLLPPPAKRHAMEYGHHPILPQHLPPSATMLTQQTPHMVGTNFVPLGHMLVRAPPSSTQVHPIGASVPPTAAGFAGDRRGVASASAWQQRK